jgi:hypothetical protein
MNESMRYHMCERKIRYKSKKSADNKLKAIRKSGVIVQDGHAYQCPVCSKWHLGHTPNPLTMRDLENVRRNNPQQPL